MRALLRPDRNTGRDGRLPLRAGKAKRAKRGDGRGVTGLDWREIGARCEGSVVSSSDAAPGKCFVMADARRDAIDGEADVGSGVAPRRGGGAERTAV